MTSQNGEQETSSSSTPLAHASPFIPYPAIERHGVIGDRRTAALVAADGTLDWLCLPDYDGETVFGALLDADKGGFWRIGPRVLLTGDQRYLEDTAVLLTTWSSPEGEVELTDFMEAPNKEGSEGPRRRPDDDTRIVVRRLRCLRGAVPCTTEIWPRHDMRGEARVQEVENGYELYVGATLLMCWASFPLRRHETGLSAEMSLTQGDELWTVVAVGTQPRDWSVDRVRRLMTSTVAYWRRWYARLTYSGPREELVKRSGMITHLLGYEPKGSLVAAPTTSLPERIGGDRNYDYRFSWIRDASLSVTTLVALGDLATGAHYLHWLSQLPPGEHGPLQVLYHVNGSPDIHVRKRNDVAGYRNSVPVLYGNRAWKQSQLGSYGFVMDCVEDFLEQDGKLEDAGRKLVENIANYTTDHWRDPDAGIWELQQQEHYVSSKVMSWVVLDRAIKVNEKYLHQEVPQRWREARDQIHAQVMDKGWSDTMPGFREHYGADSLDAATLLIPVMGFLPPSHPRVEAMVTSIESTLTIDGQVYRFVPKLSPAKSELPLGAFEGAFNPCTFWLATTYAMMGQIEKAEELLDRVESVAGPLGLFSEELDPRTWTFLGNTPLLFTHAEYVRVVRTIHRERTRGVNASAAAAAS
jgi:alpha,alpha-trehalase